MRPGFSQRLILLWLPALLSSLACASAEEAHIAVAANFKAVMDEIEDAFEAGTGHDIVISTGGTGSLYAQIRNGAPYDVFLAADITRPERLEQDGEAVAGTRFTYTIGRLVLWAPREDEIGPGHFCVLPGQRVAIAQPALAPYGRAAEETIEALGLTEELSDKLVRGENIGQTFAFVRTGNAACGFVALSQMLTLPEDARGGWWIVPQTLHHPIRQDAVLLPHGAENKAAIAFLDYLKGAEARQLIERYGYGHP